MALADVERVFRLHAGDVVRFATYLTANRAAAEDLAAEAFFRAWRTPSAIAEPAAKAYLLRTVRNLYLSQRKAVVPSAAIPAALTDPSPPPDQAAEQREALAQVARLLTELPEIDRTALLLRAVDQMPYEQIAEVLGISVANAKVKVHRARVQLLRKRSEEKS